MAPLWLWYIAFAFAPLFDFWFIDLIFSLYEPEVEQVVSVISNGKGNYLYQNGAEFMSFLKGAKKLTAWMNAMPVAISGVWLYHYLLQKSAARTAQQHNNDLQIEAITTKNHEI